MSSALVAGVACLFGVGLLSVVARHTPPTGTPYLPVQPWRALVWIALIPAYVGWGYAVAFRRHEGVSLGVALKLAIAIQAFPLIGPILFSGDVRAYGPFGRSSHPYDPPNVTADPYGPLWTLISRPIGYLSSPTFGFRLLAFASVLAICVIAARLSSSPALAVMTVGWNPLVAIHFSGGGHNDALMMALAVGAVLLAERGRTEWAGAAWAASVLVKLPVAPFYVLTMIRERRRGRGLGVRGAALMTALTVIACLPFFGVNWIHLPAVLSWNEHRRWSLGMSGWLGDLGLSSSHVTQICRALEASLVVVFAWRAARDRLRLGLAASLITIVSPKFNPWCALWALAFTAIDAKDKWGRMLVIVITGVALSDILTTVLDG